MRTITIIMILSFIVSCVKKDVNEIELTSKIPFTGKTQGMYNEHRLEYETQFKEGLANGLSKTWYENGQLWVKANYKDYSTWIMESVVGKWAISI